VRKKPFLFDSCALLKLFQKEEGFEKVVRVLEQNRRGHLTNYLNAINLGEILYVTKREFGDQKKVEVLAGIERLGFTILPIPNKLIFQAAEFKAQFGIPYADCFVLASALEHQAVIVTCDADFKKVEHVAEIFWV
jgi:predicted nucleic acid-binding protein